MITQKGAGFFDDVNSFFKDSHIISNVGSYVLPAAGAALGTLLDPFIGPAGTVVGGLVGNSANDFIKSRGYGGGDHGGHKMIGGGTPAYDKLPPLTGSFILGSGQPISIDTNRVHFENWYGQNPFPYGIPYKYQL